MNRRTFISIVAVVAPTVSAKASTTTTKRLGLTIWSYNIRWRNRMPDAQKPGWRNALDVLDHCQKLGAGCLQIGVRGWTEDFARQVRDKREALGIALEGQIGLPRTDGDLPRFEAEIRAAKEAGATILRTVCLSGRRYEKFKTLEAWKQFVADSRAALERAEPLAARHRVQLAVENHKDWRIEEHLGLLEHLGSEWIGVTLDFGNNFSLLEHPHAVAEALAPHVMSTHVKDMALAEYGGGFLLSEVPLGSGVLDLRRMMDLCEAANPAIAFNLEMITRNPLRVPVHEDGYWTTMTRLPEGEIAKTLNLAKAGNPKSLPSVEGRTGAGKLEFEEANVRRSFAFSREKLGLG